MTTRKISQRQAGRLGGIARIQRHGNPGTAAGRRKGGLASLMTHAVRDTKFKRLREVSMPRKSEKLAELIGIMLGDGHVGEYQASIATHSETDKEHLEYSQRLFLELFPGAPVRIKRRTEKQVSVLTVSSKQVCQHLVVLGLVQGNKVTQQVGVPGWIQNNGRYVRACLRGLIDTDGGVYQDRHVVRGKHYSSTCLAFTNASKPLTDFVFDSLQKLGMHPTVSYRNVRLRRKKDVVTYFAVVGSSNPKHLGRFGV